MMGDESNNMMPQFGNQHNYIQEKGTYMNTIGEYNHPRLTSAFVETCIQFLQSFQSHLDENGHYKYMEMLVRIQNLVQSKTHGSSH